MLVTGGTFHPCAQGLRQVRFAPPGTGIALLYASLTANPQGALTTRDGVVVGRLKGDSFEIDVNALRAAVPDGPLGTPGLTPAPPAPGPEGFTPAAPGGFGTREGFGIAPPTPPLGGFTPPVVAPPQTGFDPVAPGLRGGLVLENRATTPQRVHDAVAAALRSLNSGTILEGAVAQKLIGDGHVVVAFTEKNSMEMEIQLERSMLRLQQLSSK